MTCKMITSTAYILLGLGLLGLGDASAETPVPPQRPKVVKVSPEYIKKLMEERGQLIPIPAPENQVQEDQAQDLTPIPEPEPEIEIFPEPQQEPLAPVSVKPNKAVAVDVNSAQEQHLGNQVLNNTTRQEVLDILDGKSKSVPIPPHKPVAASEAEEDNKTLISFALQPSVIALDDDIVSFLKGHALKLFNENQDMTMQINAYATEIVGEKHSSIRISLARALEVRKWLMDNNISPSRLKLSHMSGDSDAAKVDRIDLILIQ